MSSSPPPEQDAAASDEVATRPAPRGEPAAGAHRPGGPPSQSPFTHREILHMISGTVLGMFLGALDQTIVATSLPAMVGELHGMEHMSWTVSAYLLTSTTSTPVYGKLSDQFGRSALFRTAIAIFLVGSVMCGLAQSMLALILGRAVQGLGGGGLIALAMTIIADIVPPRERGRYQAYFTAVWSIATIGGPMLGGVLVDVLSWRWVFWINLPIGIAALLICGRALRRLPLPTHAPHIDYLGIGLLVPAIVALLLVTTWAGTALPWTSPIILGLVAAAAILVALLVIQELRAPDPLLPPRLFRENVVVLGSAITFLTGAAAVGATIFLPLFLQVVIGASASNSGLLILPLMLGLTVGATATGRLVRITGRYKLFPIVGLFLAVAGFVAMVGVARGTPSLVYGSVMAVLGCGFGPQGPAVMIAIQNAVELRDMGTATSLNSFFRSMGGSFGVALLGAILLAGLTQENGANLSAGNLLHGGPAMIAALPDAVRQTVIASFTHSFRYVYLVGGAMCAVALVCALFLKELPLRSRTAAQRPDAKPDAH
ncbi:MAG TPA: MDR family MFS transporter [Stellaceae bacterium]|nr:MDR family MFS transporter [Stellaceae bacterium]